MPRKAAHSKTHEAPASSLNLRTATPAAAIDPTIKRFDMFLIDTGWNRPVSEIVRKHLPVLYEFQRQDSLYILTPDQSVEVLRREPTLIGHDPTLLVYDLLAGGQGGAGRFRGFRIHLGKFRSGEHAMARLQEFLRFVNMNRTAERLDKAVRGELHREGFSGAVKILREASAASIELV
ncbi:hypothetical protein [Paludisphaera rhizosphaerae]|uniref:hypothetical protein n=1 Tax=Paludisphaera rhizosphaerae TaxID=2711216 RepID=UPI0013EADBB0|nr:hypothetical protein [Paludisphaera rhizosphaerae]